MSRLHPHGCSKTAFLCVDLQKAFSERIANFGNCVFVANRMAAMHQIFPKSTYIVTEQYPKGLGHSVAELLIPKSGHVVPKTQFSCCVPDVNRLLVGVDNVVVFGIEGHVCVMQTVAELLDAQKRVFLPIDGIGSQRTTDCQTALQTMNTWGPNCILTTSESLVLQIAKDATDPTFKSVAKLLKDQHPVPY